MNSATRKIICFDLHDGKPDDYNDLYAFIEETYSGVRATESVYVIDTQTSCEKIRDDLINLCKPRKISLLVNYFPCGACGYNIDNWNKIKV